VRLDVDPGATALAGLTRPQSAVMSVHCRLAVPTYSRHLGEFETLYDMCSVRFKSSYVRYLVCACA